MRKGFAALAVVGVAACVALYAFTQTAQSTNLYTDISGADMEFIRYVAKFGKSYGTKEEFALRADIFKKNYARILEENQNKENTFTVELNKFFLFFRKIFFILNIFINKSSFLSFNIRNCLLSLMNL